MWKDEISVSIAASIESCLPVHFHYICDSICQHLWNVYKNNNEKYDIFSSQWLITYRNWFEEADSDYQTECISVDDISKLPVISEAAPKGNQLLLIAFDFVTIS